MSRSHLPIVFTSLVMLAPLSGAGAAEKGYDLRPGVEPDKTVRIEAQLDVGGDLKLVEEGKPKTLKMSVSAQLVYDEKDQSVRSAAGTTHVRSVRQYRQARAAIKIGEGAVEPKLRASRRLIVADEADGRVTLFSPTGPLTREELDLVDVPANSLLLDQLLPFKAVKVGDRWRHDSALMAALLGLDVVSQSDVESELKDVAADRARLEMAGKLLGAVGGVATEIEVKAKYRFDFNQRRVTGLGLLVKEKRAIGLVNAGLDVVAKLQLALAPSSGGEQELSEAALAQLPLEPRPEFLTLECVSPTKKFSIYHNRNWHLMTDAGELLALRYLDRGELVAQCNVSSLADVEPGKEPSLATFQHDLERSLGESFGRYLEASEATNSLGHHIYRIVAEGRVSDLPIQWRYYLIADRKGHLAVFAFTVESDLAERLGNADEQLAATIEFAANSTTGKPTRAAARK
ncbi:MAG TPA: hypothetical protein VFI31_20555 [Pirellulales bacterium]|nr:hypothetical protein [Pirellulales bacterium]